MRLSLEKSLVDSFGLHVIEVMGSVENRDKNWNKICINQIDSIHGCRLEVARLALEKRFLSAIQ